MSPSVLVVVDHGDRPAPPSPLIELLDGSPDRGTVLLGSAAERIEAELREHDTVWFLPPEALPDPAALPTLLASLARADSVGAVGPTILDPARHVLSAGVTTTPAGLRHNPASAGEVDAGQYSRHEDTFALDLPGLLVRAAVVAEVGLPSTVLAPSYSGIEYCRRIREAGHLVHLVPAASLVLTSGDARTSDAAGEDPGTTEVPGSGDAVEEPRSGTRNDLLSSPRPVPSPEVLRAEHRHRLAVTPSRRAGGLALWLVLASVSAAVWQLLCNAPRRAAWYLSAALHVPADASATKGLRRSRRGVTGEAWASLYTNRRALRVSRRENADAAPGGAAASTAPGGWDTPSLGDTASADTDEAFESFSRIEAREGIGPFGRPLTWVLVLTTAASVLLFHGLFAPGALTGGALARVDVPLTEAWARVFSPVLTAGTGSIAPADPLLAVLALLALPTFGRLDLVLSILWFAALPLAALGMSWAAGRFTSSRAVRALLGLVWAASPAFLVALTTGRTGLVLGWILLPLLVRAGHTARVARSATALAVCGLLGAVLAAAVPALIPVLLLAGLVLALLVRTPGTAWLFVPFLGLCGPWAIGAVRQADVLLTDPGAVLDFLDPPAAGVALGWPSFPPVEYLSSWVDPTAALWILLALSVPLVLALVLALLRIEGSTSFLSASVVLYVVGLAGALAQCTFAAALTADRLVASFPGASLLLVSAGLCGLLVAALRPPGRTRLSRVRTGVLGSLVPLGACSLLAVFVVGSFTSGIEVERTQDAPLPAYASERSTGPAQARTLVLGDRDGQLYGSLASARTGTLLEESTLHEAASVHGGWTSRRPVGLDEADTELATTIAGLTAGDGQDVRESLRRFGVGFVVIDADDDASLSRLVSVSPGLTRLSTTAQGELWQVEMPEAAASQAYLLDAAGVVTSLDIVDGRIEVPAGAPDRTLVLARRASTVTPELDGVELPRAASAPSSDSAEAAAPARTTADWQARHVVGAEGGTVVLDDPDDAWPWIVAAGFGLLVLSVLAALPFDRVGPYRTRRGSLTGLVPMAERRDPVSARKDAGTRHPTAEVTGTRDESSPEARSHDAASHDAASHDPAESTEEDSVAAPTRRRRRRPAHTPRPTTTAQRRASLLAPAGRAPEAGTTPDEVATQVTAGAAEVPASGDAPTVRDARNHEEKA